MLLNPVVAHLPFMSNFNLRWLHGRTIFYSLWPITYNQLAIQERSCDSAIDGAVPEVFGPKPTGESFLQLSRTTRQHVLSGA